jgi:enamine deaminase RidA (YjgF/YER057c/UK114 family)
MEVRSMDVAARLRELGLSLPEPPPALGAYRPWVRSGSLLFLSGQFPLTGGRLVYSGRLGEMPDREGYEAARLCALNALAQIHAALGSWDGLKTLVRVEGHLAVIPGWGAHAQVLDGASELFQAVLGARAGHARSVFGHPSLPATAPVELVVTAAVHEESSAAKQNQPTGESVPPR